MNSIAGYNRLKIVKFLLDKGADVHAKDKGGLIALHNSSSYGHYEVTKLLIEYGSNCNTCDLWNFTALHESALKSRLDVCSLLLSYNADPYIRNCHSKTTIDLASNNEIKEKIVFEHNGYLAFNYIKNGDFIRLKSIVNSINDIVKFKHYRTGDTLLHACFTNVNKSNSGLQKQIIEYLIKKGVNINERNHNLDSVLHIAIANSNKNSNYKTIFIDLIELLLRHNIKSNLVDKNGDSALHLAARLNMITICKLLITYNFDVTLKSLNGQNVLQMTNNEHLKQYFYEQFNKQQSTIFDDTNSIDVQLLLESSKCGDLEVIKRILNINPNLVNCTDKDGRLSTPLHFAAGFNRYELCTYLIKMGGDVHAKDKGGLTPLHNSVSYGHFEVSELLLKNNANVNSTDLYDYTPLHEAALKRRYEICKLLIQYGADRYKKNRDGHTAYDLIKDTCSDDDDLVDLLLGENIALLDACKKGNLERVKRLVNEINVNCQDTHGRNSSPLHLAGEYNHVLMVF